MNILFICKYNRFRSRVAASYFKKVNKNKNIKVKSAGAIKGSPVDKFQKKVIKKFGINISGSPQGLSTRLLKWQDVVIIVADNVPLELFSENKSLGKKVIYWKIKDATEDDEKIVEDLISQIIKRVDLLVKELDIVEYVPRDKLNKMIKEGIEI